MMDLYEKTTYDIQRYIQWPEINFEENHPVPITVFEEIESDVERVKEEITNLKAEIHKRRKIDDETTPLQETILDQHAKLYDVRMECFDKVKKMANKVKMIEKHLDIVSQTHQKMRDLQEKIIELDEWRRTKRDIPNSLHSLKT